MSLSGQSALMPDVSVPRRAAKLLAFALDDVQPEIYGDVILAYHRVGGTTPSPVDLGTAMFERQMAHLRATEDVYSLDELVAYHQNSVASAQRGVALTFDDGTADFAEIALPVLVRYSLPVTLYLATGFVDSRQNYPAEGRPISWNGLRDALTTGLVTIGAHTHTHRMLDRCSLADATTELDVCIGRIEDELGVTPNHFAYPKALSEHGSGVAGLVRERFRSAAVAGTRPNARDSSDVFRLNRSPIQNADAWEGFRRKVAGGMRVEDDVRRVINLVRYRGKSQ